MAKIESFRFWCQKVLPLVYDESLSYYELLCKMTTYLNNTIQAVNENTDDVAQMRQELNQFEEFINNYFDNLDVQQEIDNKLDAMAESGELDTILAPFVPDAVADWLSEHITPTTPAVDDTLSIPGAAADAKVTGDNTRKAIKYTLVTNSNYSDIVTDFDNVTENVFYSLVGVSSLISHYPTNGFSQAPTGFVGVTNKVGRHSNGDFQFVFDRNNNVAFRLYANNAWSSWTNFNRTTNKLITSANYQTEVTDLNNIMKNCVYSFVGVSNLIANYPARGFSSTPVLFLHLQHAFNTRSNGDLQIIFSGKNEYAIRLYASGAWSDWNIGEERVETFVTGTNNFAATIKAANASKSDKVHVLVKRGVYDLNTELASYFETASGTISECLVSRDMTVEFEEGAIVKCNYTGDNNFVKSEFSCLTSRTNDLSVINGHFEGSNIRYIIHDEHGTDTQPYTSKYIDCIMKLDNTNNAQWTAGNCIGSGLGKSGYIVIDGGCYEGYGPNSSNLSDIRFHNNGNYADAKSHVVVKNTYCRRTVGSFSYGTSPELTELEICGNSFGSDIQEGYSTGGEVYNMYVRKWNNEIRS